MVYRGKIGILKYFYGMSEERKKLEISYVAEDIDKMINPIPPEAPISPLMNSDDTDLSVDLENRVSAVRMSYRELWEHTLSNRTRYFELCESNKDHPLIIKYHTAIEALREIFDVLEFRHGRNPAFWPDSMRFNGVHAWKGMPFNYMTQSDEEEYDSSER